MPVQDIPLLILAAPDCRLLGTKDGFTAADI